MENMILLSENEFRIKLKEILDSKVDDIKKQGSIVWFSPRGMRVITFVHKETKDLNPKSIKDFKDIFKVGIDHVISLHHQFRIPFNDDTLLASLYGIMDTIFEMNVDFKRYKKGLGDMRYIA